MYIIPEIYTYVEHCTLIVSNYFGKSFVDMDPTPVPSGELKQPRIVSTAPCMDTTLPTMATCADQC